MTFGRPCASRRGPRHRLGSGCGAEDVVHARRQWRLHVRRPPASAFHRRVFGLFLPSHSCVSRLTLACVSLPHVTVISPRNYFMFTPLLPMVAVGADFGSSAAAVANCDDDEQARSTPTLFVQTSENSPFQICSGRMRAITIT
jgi:hypothetical protein